MSASKSQSLRNVNRCEKCAGELHDRIMYIKNLKDFIKIKQCFVCRYWFEDI